MNVFIDVEWSRRGDIFLLGYGYNTRQYGFLYDESLTPENIFGIMAGMDFVFVWGPDIGKIESYFGMDIRGEFRCVNLLSVVRDYVNARDYRLDTIERKFGIHREVNLKDSRFDLYTIWKTNPERVKLYNLQDVVSLYNIYMILRERYGLTYYDFRRYEMN